MYSDEVVKICKKLQKARFSLMERQPFYAVLLLQMTFSLDPMCETACTDGKRIIFCPDFVTELSDPELEFVLMHEVLHVALNHCNRNPETHDFDAYNIACDIVVNSNILYSCGMDEKAITLKDYGVSMHQTPAGEEGYLYSAEEVYRMIRAEMLSRKKQNGGKRGASADDPGKASVSGDPGAGQIASRSDGGFDDHTCWGEAEEGEGQDECGEDKGGTGQEEDEKLADLRDLWDQRLLEAAVLADRIMRNQQGGKNCGAMPLMAERILKKLTEPQTDWREILQDFVQEEVNDYSLEPPDRRFQDSPFLLPDYNEKDACVRDVWFVVDASGSMSDDAITAAYSEICGAIDQFDGKLEGWLSFFDTKVTDPVEFKEVKDVLDLKPTGGGGTSFQAVFDQLKENRQDELPKFIIVITDGFCAFPSEEAALGIPVLWLLNNEEITPPWGRVARIKVLNQVKSGGHV